MEDGVDWVDDLDEAQKLLDFLTFGEESEWKYLTHVGNFLERCAKGEEEWCSPDDPEFQRLREKFNSHLETYWILSAEAKRLSDDLRVEDTSAAWVDTLTDIDTREFSQEEVNSLEFQRNAKKEVVVRLLQAVLGTKYAWGDVLKHASDLQSSILSEEYSRFLEVITRAEWVEEDDINALWDIYSYDIVELTTIAQNGVIKLRDARDINGISFWQARESHVEDLYKNLQESGSEEILDIIAPKWEDGERVPKDFSELTAAELWTLRESGMNFSEMFLITEDGEAVSSSDFQEGANFVLNIWNNQELTEYNLLQFTQWAQVILVDGVRAEYRESSGEKPAGYYSESWIVHPQDGMKITIQSLADDTTRDNQDNVSTTQTNAVINSSAGREMYRQALENPDDPIQGWWLIGAILRAILKAIKGEDVQQQPDGTFTARNPQTWEYEPVTGQQYMEAYTWNIQSHPIEYTASWVTACGRTAWKNLKDLWARNPERNDAHVLAARYQNSGMESNMWFPRDMPEWTRTVQLFMDASRSASAQWYKHTACAFKDGEWNWFVLDPYYGMQWRWTATRNPIPAGQYMNYMMWTLWKTFYGAYDV